jgi:hypothetical protein
MFGLAVLWLVACGAQAQVEITSFSGNGVLHWACPTNSDCTVEWASTLTPPSGWSDDWGRLRDIHSTNGTGTAGVPMFYRVSCWTNGLFVRYPLDRSLYYAISNGLGQTDSLELCVQGTFRFNNTTYKYVIPNMDHELAEGVQPQGPFNIRSTDRAAYVYAWWSLESLEWQDAPIGTVWTNNSNFGTNQWVYSVVARETVTVPAGVFTDCIKYHKVNPGSSHPTPEWFEWVKPGFGMVKKVDYLISNTNAAPVTYELQSWKDW